MSQTLMEAWLSKLPMAKPIHPFIHVGLTGGGAYHSGLRSHLAPYLFSVGKSNYQIPGRTSLVYLSLWKEATACSFPLPVAKIVPPQSQGTVFPQQEELLDITASVHYHPALLYREDAGLKKKKKSRSGSNVEREIFIGFVWFRLWLLSLQTNPLRLDSKGERVHLQAVTRWEHP